MVIRVLLLALTTVVGSLKRPPYDSVLFWGRGSLYVGPKNKKKKEKRNAIYITKLLELYPVLRHAFCVSRSVHTCARRHQPEIPLPTFHSRRGGSGMPQGREGVSSLLPPGTYLPVFIQHMLDIWREYKDRVGGEELVWGGVRADGGAGGKPTSNSQVAAAILVICS